MLKFSVIVPAYNCAEYIEETLNSILSQSYENYEVIVVNDGSTDNTSSILQDFVNNKSDRVTILEQPNQGVSAARNNAVSVASGDYLAFIDSDDIWLDDKLAQQLGVLKNGYEICYSNRYNFGDIDDLPVDQSKIVDMPQGNIYQKLLDGNFITASSVVIKKALFDSLGGFNTELSHCEDWDLWLKCAELCSIGMSPEPLVRYRIHPAGLSKGYRAMHLARIKVLTRSLSSGRGQKLDASDRKQVLSNAYSCSAWEAAKAGDNIFSLKCYFKAIALNPISSSWYDILRLLCGRV